MKLNLILPAIWSGMLLALQDERLFLVCHATLSGLKNLKGK